MPPLVVSYDQYSNVINFLKSKKDLNLNAKQGFKYLVSDSYPFINRYLNLLPITDRCIAKFYYLDKLSQDQIAVLLEISQAAVSRRLKYIIERIKFLIKMPSLNPIQVREELMLVFPPNLYEFAYYFYWELAQNRVKYLIDTSQSGAANKLTQILRYLEKVISKLSIKDVMNTEEQELYCLALIYLDYFRVIKEKSNIITFLYKKNDDLRTNSIYLSKPIFVVQGLASAENSNEYGEGN